MLDCLSDVYRLPTIDSRLTRVSLNPFHFGFTGTSSDRCGGYYRAYYQQPQGPH
uniref:Uncharacterized protein n=1 Tax=Anguilla anguilla TaxID=7936 RepID=A0A0E9S4Y9_ANGAN